MEVLEVIWVLRIRERAKISFRPLSFGTGNPDSYRNFQGQYTPWQLKLPAPLCRLIFIIHHRYLMIDTFLVNGL